MNDDLSAARAKLAGARDLVRILCDRIYHMNEMVRSRRLEHDELVQLAYQFRSTQVAKDRAMDDARAWRRVIDRLEGRDPDSQEPSIRVRRRMAQPGYLARTTDRSVGVDPAKQPRVDQPESLGRLPHPDARFQLRRY
jgi:hypothetical protein